MFHFRPKAKCDYVFTETGDHPQNKVFTCTLTLGKEGEAQFVGRKVLLRNFQNHRTFDLRVRLLGFSQERQVIRKRPKGQ